MYRYFVLDNNYKRVLLFLGHPVRTRRKMLLLAWGEEGGSGRGKPRMLLVNQKVRWILPREERWRDESSLSELLHLLFASGRVKPGAEPRWVMRLGIGAAR